MLKPAPDTPWSATVLGKLIAEETDIPAGVVNVVTSADHLVGEVLTSDPMVDMVTFTGSTATGRRIMATAAETVKKVFLELGGKSANVILDDADFAAAVPSGSMICMHGGQGCAITTRMLLPKSHYDEAVDMLKTAFENVPYGDPTRTVPAEGEAITNQGSVPIGTRRAKDPLSRLKAHNAESYP